ncbi:zinc ABC transporter substrate-binding protein [Panacibacter ginsenosidivorans]|uniref:Zinc ABC transporter substrate-binding protein n=2 Tax=Panacibacter ginsenosidivorans TaxID=1813871 RepID=A0A5B8V7T2_9BACT|nr:zinc ABC transporter substrate-binding protein [Panacibacter ginsenosidivorans]
MMKKRSIVFTSLLLLIVSIAKAGTVKVVTTTTDMQSIAQLIGGDKVSVSSIATGYQNPHFVDPKPSYIISLTHADLFVTVGLDLETGWSPQLLSSSRNTKIQKGSAGYVDASEGVSLVQVPTSANRGEGDIHIFGNPHYWLDPLNGKIIARNIANGLERVDPSNKATYENNLQAFNNNIDAKMKDWQAKMAPFKGSKIIAYHNEWVYFETRFGLKIVDFMEPKPGIPPTPSQLVKVINEVKANNIKVIISSPYFTTSSSDVVSKQTGVKELTIATSTGAFPAIKSYFDLFDYDINQLIAVLK